MKVTIFGSGYVGLVTGVCLAEVGHHVTCVDIDQNKIDKLNQGILPIYEPGLEDMVLRNTASGKLHFTTDLVQGVHFGQLQFIAVGTPPDEDGSADLQYVLAVAESIAAHMTDYKVVVDKSTVPVGTADKVKAAIQAGLAKRGLELEFDVVSNPEFLKEGAAIDDFMKPDRIVLGTDSTAAAELLAALYAPFNRNHQRLVLMDVRSAELTKYAANALLATKISFMNELANLAERLGADIEQVRLGIGSDPRIGYHFIYPGCGYGGSCFPKDVSALAQTALAAGYVPELLNAVEAVNSRQKQRLFQKIQHHFKHDLQGKTFAIWGLAFKPNTDDMREASSRNLIESLWLAGASVRVYDPKALEETQRIYGERPEIQYCHSPEEAAQGADALVVVTEWKQFRSLDFEFLRLALKQPIIFDGRNLYQPEELLEQGFIYYAIGRGVNEFKVR